jgi:hypothetical protein
MTALMTAILTLAGVITAPAARTYLFVSLFLLQICILVRIIYNAKAKPEPKKTLHIGGILVLAIALLTILSVLIPPFEAVTGMGTWTVLTAILLLLSPIIYWILHLLLPFFGRTAK